MKNSKYVRYIFTKICRVLTTISPTLCSKFLYRMVIGEKLNLKNPKKFNEKLMWLKLNVYYKNDLVTMCADKYRVREYIKEKKCEEILNELLFVYNSPKDIDFDKLPNKFALKLNNGCGCNIICSDKKKLDIKDARKKFKKWFKMDHWKDHAEINYKYIKNKIICEKYIDNNEDWPYDYKFFCFNGEPMVVQMCTNRNTNVKFSYFDSNWKPLDIGTKPNDLSLEKPKSFEKMKKYARKLSEDIPFVRIDFYENKGKVIFGEMTFTPSGCLKALNKEGAKYLGDLLDLSKIKK